MVSSLHLLHASDPSQVSVPAANMFMRRSVYKFILVHFVNLHVTQVLLKMAQDIAANEEQPMLIDGNLFSTVARFLNFFVSNRTRINALGHFTILLP